MRQAGHWRSSLKYLPIFPADVIEKILSTYLGERDGEETFLDTYRRIGIDPFKERVYAKAD